MRTALLLAAVALMLAGCGSADADHRGRPLEAYAARSIGDGEVLLLAYGSGSDARFEVGFKRSGGRAAVPIVRALHDPGEFVLANRVTHCIRATVPEGIDPAHVLTHPTFSFPTGGTFRVGTRTVGHDEMVRLARKDVARRIREYDPAKCTKGKASQRS